MKNYVVWTDCDIREDTCQFGIEPAQAPGVREHYSRMQEISELTARRFLQGSWQSVVFREPALTRRHMFEQNWQRIWDLWHNEPCNILYLDSDTVFVNPVDPWNRWPNFRLFNHAFGLVPDCFEHYFNAGVRYYPATMSQDVWDLGASMALTWDHSCWDQEQIIFNHMLWLENRTLESVFEPRMNWSAHHGNALRDLDDLSASNQGPWQEAWIVHYHASRGSERGRALGQALATARGIPI